MQCLNSLNNLSSTPLQKTPHCNNKAFSDKKGHPKLSSTQKLHLTDVSSFIAKCGKFWRGCYLTMKNLRAVIIMWIIDRGECVMILVTRGAHYSRQFFELFVARANKNIGSTRVAHGIRENNPRKSVLPERCAKERRFRSGWTIASKVLNSPRKRNNFRLKNKLLWPFFSRRNTPKRQITAAAICINLY